MNCGAFGRVQAAYGIGEEQGNGNLHLHGVFYGSWNIAVIQQWCHQNKFRKMFEKMIDSHITCRISKELKTRQDTSTHWMDIFKQYPTSATVSKDAEMYAARLNNHKHSETCWKNSQQCRLAFRQPIAEKTFFSQIEADDDGFIQKQIAPPPQKDAANAFNVQDERTIVYRIARTDAFEQMQVEYNPLTTALLRCNTSMQVLLTQSQAKAAMFYISKYMSKNPFQLQSTVALIYQSTLEQQKYASQADDNHSKTRKAKNILQKILNKHDLMEVSDQQSAASVIGYKSYFSSHNFTFIQPWAAVSYFRQKCHPNASIEISNENLQDLEIESDTAKATAMSKFELYLNRGFKLKELCFYDYCMRIGTRAVRNKTKKEDSNNCTKAGRPTNATFPFEPHSKPSKCFEQIIMSCPAIPRIAGTQPPKYPGSDASVQEQQTFVEFYTLLFVPLDITAKPLAKFGNILPFSAPTSWISFWKLFNGFEKSTSWYQRSKWCIFRNMVTNLRQTSQERTLVQKWRFVEADIRSNDTTLRQTDSHKKHKQELQYANIDDDENDMQALCEMIRAKHGTDDFLSNSEKELKKSVNYLNHQLTTYQSLTNHHIQVSQKKQFQNFTVRDCESMNQKFLDTSVSEEETDANILATNLSQSEKLLRLTDKPVHVLKKHQEDAVKKLQEWKSEMNQDPALKKGQILVFIQGVPGSGKTTTAKCLAERLGLNFVFAGTTSTASAQLRTETINVILKLGLNLNNLQKTDISYETKQFITTNFAGKDGMIIDEISMMTPITLAKNDLHLRSALDPNFVFAGLDVILLGDFLQFDPVAPGLKNPALYQAAVKLGLGESLPNEAYRIGANLFTKFRLLELDGQVRASPMYDEWLAKLRNLNVAHPITDNWLSQLNILSQNDFDSNVLDWYTTPIVVSGNPERRMFIKEKLINFAKRYNQPVLRWICPVRSSRHKYTALPFDPEGIYDELVRYFVPGSKCILTDSINTKLGLGKGVEGIFIDAVWTNDEINIKKLPKAEITTVSQPEYIVIQINKQFLSIKRTPTQLTDKNGKKRTYYSHKCQSGESRTYHKEQGKTESSLILSLNSRSNISKRIHPLNLHSVYVGVSRVHNHEHLRILPLSVEDKNYLKSLQWDPMLRLYFQNYDKNGRWKHNGLTKIREQRDRKTKTELAFVALDALTIQECKQFVKRLDVIVASELANPTKEEYLQALKKSHAEGYALINENNGALLNQHRKDILNELAKISVNTLPLRKLRYFAKHLQIDYTAMNKATLQDTLQCLMEETEKK